ncbi:MAG: hypothetical protein FJ267_00060 [Planctomycetes bacterium]|nr:hypothetical protein [Planctomycetota bacterium]
MTDIPADTVSASSQRFTAIDQYRGYTMAGMFLVNFFGGFDVCPVLWQHRNDYCSYADTIMPHFFFVAGFTLRLSYVRKKQQGASIAWTRLIRRVIVLAFVAILYYGYGELAEIQKRLPNEGVIPVLGWLFKSPLFQTLLHIAVTSLWILPVIWCSSRIRICYAVFSALLHLGLSWLFYFNWVHTAPESIDGGPLGFLTWCIPMIAGTVACDVRVKQPEGGRLIFHVVVGICLAITGWLLSWGTTIYNVPRSEWESRHQQKYDDHPVIPSAAQWEAWRITPSELPFVPPPESVYRKHNYWMMSQQHGTPSYLVFSAGISFLVLAAFLWLTEQEGIEFPFLRTLGVNALAGYILHGLVSGWTSNWLSLNSESSGTAVYSGFFLSFALVYIVLRVMEWRQVFFRV